MQQRTKITHRLKTSHETHKEQVASILRWRGHHNILAHAMLLCMTPKYALDGCVFLEKIAIRAIASVYAM